MEVATAVRQHSAPPDAVPVLPGDVVHRLLPTDDGGMLHVLERGTGTPVVMLHGFTLTSRVWTLQFERLGQANRVVAVDLRGHGRSRGGSGGLGLERMAEDVVWLLEALDLREVVLVGHSMGGMVALMVAGIDAERDHGRVRSLLLLGTSAGPVRTRMGWALPLLRSLQAGSARARGGTGRGSAASPEPCDTAVRGSAPDRSRRPGARAPARSAPLADAAWALARISFGSAPEPALVRMTWSMTAATAARTVAAQLVDLLAFDRSARVESLSLPTTVMVGSQDRILPASHSEKLAGLVPGADLVIVAGKGHMLMLEDPSVVEAALERLKARAENAASAPRSGTGDPRTPPG